MRSSIFLSALAALAPLVTRAAPVAVDELDVVTALETSQAEDVAGALERRAVSCSKTSQCKQTIPANAQRVCLSSKKCSWTCKSGYTKSGTKCVKKAVASAANYQLSTKSDVVSSSGVKSFTGTNTGAIVSWYHTNSATDSTNGHSWCLYPYDDNVPGFAVSLNTMLADFNGDENAARAAYCGLGATFTTSNGVSQTLYIADAFDDQYVRTSTSADVIYNAFTKLNGGQQTNDKNVVLSNVSWRFTGSRNSRYAVNGAGSG
ncbi:hypothetical protein JCM3775_000678 [Rhodotorula graminis]|uniref:Uncharacterized protein n=1 Tax=Rhodotorula graminis (strain WP1) TaxID=578459 RepID=A0A194S7U1_RHOGW|nr:uncharacterized protein RHOBADRAFT_51789 [Rhodotorula graminis WP1]KPV76798.1 hypothetical protein RHOBADRAFT_51789 [Rhodotorula graminis WP1]